MRSAIMISGRGSTMQALLDLSSSLRVSLVVSSKDSAPGLIRAKRMGIPTLVAPKVTNQSADTKTDKAGKKIDYVKLNKELKTRGIGRIFLAGFMKILPESFLQQWSGRIVNIHPSLLPLYPGLAAFESSHAEKNHMGASLHLVTPELDGGPLLQQVRFFSKDHWAFSGPSFKEAQVRLSFTEQRLVREVQKIWK